MLDIQLRPEKYLTAEDVSSLVGGNEELVPLPRPRPGRRFQQVQVTVAGVATGLFLSDILHHVLGHNDPEIGYVALMMMVCVLVCFCLDKPSYRMEEYAVSLKPGAYMCFMAAIGGLALAMGGPTLGVNIGFIPSLIVGAAIFAAAGLAQLMRHINTYAFGITVPAAAYFGGQAALITLFAVAGVLAIYSLARHYFAEKEDVSLAELMTGCSELVTV